MSFFSQLDNDRIVAAIADAERKSSGEIRVHVTGRKPEDLEARARRRFELLGMTKTADRNGVLLYIAPAVRRFQILGDEGIHEKAGPDFWKEVAAEMEERFRRGEFTDGIVRGVEKVGEILARHFPRSREDRDELPDTVDEES
ncbi:MAG: TPM domain-containing protein [Acidobacteriota bacterium]|nr:TPM domain-containing protein [Acidobacteriota bacterium]MDQ5873182.1 TPM domain-containing protein [Acidobacteriota bacterium]